MGNQEGESGESKDDKTHGEVGIAQREVVKCKVVGQRIYTTPDIAQDKNTWTGLVPSG